jgi:predicted PhzF superfamily epimerase YddE/YHI9
MKIYQVDSFTDRAFAGNPAGVCLLDQPREDAWMQAVAAEMNLSETAFVLAEGDDYNLRWMTPSTEVDLCGHATLATAHILWETRRAPADEALAFHTRSGVLRAQRAPHDLPAGLIELDFPALLEEPASLPPGLGEVLGAHPKYVGTSAGAFLLELESEEVVRALRPDFAALRGVPALGVIVTSAADSEGFDFVSRFFAPWIGIDEDPVTGFSHCILTPYWSKRFGGRPMRAYQASARGGVVRVRLEAGRVLIGGNAVTIFEGELRV